jgi:hypothetical protein
VKRENHVTPADVGQRVSVQFELPTGFLGGPFGRCDEDYPDAEVERPAQLLVSGA